MPRSTTTDPTASRRRVAAICLMLAPVADMVEAATWPVGSDGSTAQELQAAATAPGAYTAAWMLESLGAALALVGVIALLGRLRGRGRVLALIGAVLAVGGEIGTFTGGGFNAAIVPLAQQPERSVAVRTLDAFNAQPAIGIFAALIWAGLLGILLLAVAAVRGGLVRWWVLVVFVVALVVAAVLDNGLYGPAAAAPFIPYAVAVIALGVALFRSPTTESGPVTAAPPVMVGATS